VQRRSRRRYKVGPAHLSHVGNSKGCRRCSRQPRYHAGPRDHYQLDPGRLDWAAISYKNRPRYFAAASPETSLTSQPRRITLVLAGTPLNAASGSKTNTNIKHPCPLHPMMRGSPAFTNPWTNFSGFSYLRCSLSAFHLLRSPCSISVLPILTIRRNLILNT
jgi:hypothetical protein